MSFPSELPSRVMDKIKAAFTKEDEIKQMSSISQSNECFHGNHSDCEICRCGCHNEWPLTIEELIALYRILEHQYINYEDEEANAVVNKISKIVNESNMVR